MLEYNCCFFSTVILDRFDYINNANYHLKLCGNACGLPLWTSSASQAVGTIPTIETLPSQTARLFLCRPGTESRCHHRDGSKFAQKRLDSFRLRADLLTNSVYHCFISANFLFAPNVTLNQFNTYISEVTLAVSRYGLRPSRGQCFRLRAETD